MFLRVSGFSWDVSYVSSTRSCVYVLACFRVLLGRKLCILVLILIVKDLDNGIGQMIKLSTITRLSGLRAARWTNIVNFTEGSNSHILYIIQ